MPLSTVASPGSRRRWLPAQPDCLHSTPCTGLQQQGCFSLGGATMNGLIRKAGLLALGALFLAGVAAAGVPTQANSTLTLGIPLGAGSTAGGGQWDVDNGIEVVSPGCSRTFTIRDANNIAV